MCCFRTWREAFCGEEYLKIHILINHQEGVFLQKKSQETIERINKQAVDRTLTRYGVPEMLLKPSKQTVQRAMHSSSIPESVRGHTDVLYPGLDTGKIPQEELPWELLACTQKVRDSLWGFLFFYLKNFF